MGPAVGIARQASVDAAAAALTARGYRCDAKPRRRSANVQPRRRLIVRKRRVRSSGAIPRHQVQSAAALARAYGRTTKATRISMYIPALDLRELSLAGRLALTNR